MLIMLKFKQKTPDFQHGILKTIKILYFCLTQILLLT